MKMSSTMLQALLLASVVIAAVATVTSPDMGMFDYEVKNYGQKVPAGRAGAQLFHRDGKFYVVGGQDEMHKYGACTDTKDTACYHDQWEFDTATAEWKEVSFHNYPTPRQSAAVYQQPGSDIAYVFFGLDGDGNGIGAAMYREIYEVNLTTLSYRQLPIDESQVPGLELKFPSQRAVSTSIVLFGNKIYVQFPYVMHLLSYNLDTYEWKMEKTTNNITWCGRASASLVVRKGKIYAMGPSTIPASCAPAVTSIEYTWAILTNDNIAVFDPEVNTWNGFLEGSVTSAAGSASYLEADHRLRAGLEAASASSSHPIFLVEPHCILAEGITPPSAKDANTKIQLDEQEVMALGNDTIDAIFCMGGTDQALTTRVMSNTYVYYFTNSSKRGFVRTKNALATPGLQTSNHVEVDGKLYWFGGTRLPRPFVSDKTEIAGKEFIEMSVNNDASVRLRMHAVVQDAVRAGVTVIDQMMVIVNSISFENHSMVVEELNPDLLFKNSFINDLTFRNLESDLLDVGYPGCGVGGAFPLSVMPAYTRDQETGALYQFGGFGWDLEYGAQAKLSPTCPNALSPKLVKAAAQSNGVVALLAISRPSDGLCGGYGSCSADERMCNCGPNGNNGPFCSPDAGCPFDCNNHGTCNTDGECECSHPYFGEYCEHGSFFAEDDVVCYEADLERTAYPMSAGYDGYAGINDLPLGVVVAKLYFEMPVETLELVDSVNTTLGLMKLWSLNMSGIEPVFRLQFTEYDPAIAAFASHHGPKPYFFETVNGRMQQVGTIASEPEPVWGLVSKSLDGDWFGMGVKSFGMVFPYNSSDVLVTQEMIENGTALDNINTTGLIYFDGCTESIENNFICKPYWRKPVFTVVSIKRVTCPVEEVEGPHNNPSSSASTPAGDKDASKADGTGRKKQWWWWIVIAGAVGLCLLMGALCMRPKKKDPKVPVIPTIQPLKWGDNPLKPDAPANPEWGVNPLPAPGIPGETPMMHNPLSPTDMPTMQVNELAFDLNDPDLRTDIS